VQKKERKKRTQIHWIARLQEITNNNITNCYTFTLFIASWRSGSTVQRGSLSVLDAGCDIMHLQQQPA
jgi:hypothetical protein